MRITKEEYEELIRYKDIAKKMAKFILSDLDLTNQYFEYLIRERDGG